MIIEVALGIVLGVLMLRFLPLLVAAGVAVLVLTCVGTLIALVLLWITSNEWLVVRALVVGAPIAAMIIGQVLATALASRTVFTTAEVTASLLVCMVAVGAMVMLFTLVQSGINPPLEPALRFVVLPALFFWCLLLLVALASRLQRASQSRRRTPKETS